MKKALLLVTLLLMVGGFALAGHHEKAVTMEGKMACAKCTLKAEDVEGCQAVLVVKKGDAEKHYWLTKNETADNYGEVCGKKGSPVRVTGMVAEKEGKMWLTASKIEEVEKG